MFTGSIVNSCSVLIGGIIGTAVGQKLSQNFKDNLNMVLGTSAFVMAFVSLLRITNLAAVILSVIIGTILGLTMHLGKIIQSGGLLMNKLIGKIAKNHVSDLNVEQEKTFITAITLFCASGTGIYGALVSGMTGDQSILLSKSILDCVTAVIFSCSLGIVVSFIAVPQFLIYFILIVLAQFIYPLCTETMINDFKAVGGVIILANGFRMLKLKDIPVADMIPAMVIAMPVSYLYTEFIAPLF